MNEPKTPNLGLNKIDRSSPSTTYFDLDKYLDQNWEKVDEGVGQVVEKAEETAAQVRSIQERLDTEKRRSVTLEPGLQIINAERASAFKLEGLKGRTLVNLLGRDGNFGVANNWSEFAGTKAVANKVITVTGNGSDINPQVSNNKFISSLTPKVGDKLFLRVRARPVVGTVQQLQLYLFSATLSRVTAKNISNPLNGTTYDMYGSITVTQALVNGWNSNLGLKLAATYATVAASNGSQVQYSQAAIYKISEADKSLTDDQFAAKYPYVDSVQPVRNPYAIRYGENLLPPFYEWTLFTGAILNAPYNFTYSYASGNASYNTVNLPTIPGQTYTLTVNNSVANARNVMNFYGEDGTQIQGTIVSGTATPTSAGVNIVTYQAPAGAKTMRMHLYGNVAENGTVTFSDPMLVIGTKSKPFKPCEDAMFALQTDLYADPATGAYTDEVFEKDGHYFKVKNWQGLTLDGSKAWANGEAGLTTGLKQVKAAGVAIGAVAGSGIGTKFDGKLLPQGSTGSTPDTNAVTAVGDVYISIPSVDSGWGDSYTPTANEIKAYFMGYKMAQNVTGFPVYNGTGVKCWYGIKSISAPTTTLPTTEDVGYTPYQLLYQLTTPTVESITSEGQLTLIEGSNQVEVGTGIVLRERVNPFLSGGSYHINNTAVAGTSLKFKTNKILNVFMGSKDSAWIKRSDNANGYGGGNTYVVESQYKTSESYSVTYLMLDTSPVAAFVGSVSDNEKALLTDLTDILRQNTVAVSVVETSLNDAIRTLIQPSQQQQKRNVWGPII